MSDIFSDTKRVERFRAAMILDNTLDHTEYTDEDLLHILNLSSEMSDGVYKILSSGPEDSLPLGPDPRGES